MDTSAQAKEYSSDLEAHNAFCFLVLCHWSISLDKVEEDFQRVVQKSFLCWRLCTTPGNKPRGGLGERADIKSTVTCFSSQKAWLYTLLEEEVMGVRAGRVSLHSLRKQFPPALLQVGMGSLQENPEGCTVPEDVLAVKYKALHNLAEHALNLLL